MCLLYDASGGTWSKNEPETFATKYSYVLSEEPKLFANQHSVPCSLTSLLPLASATSIHSFSPSIFLYNFRPHQRVSWTLSKPIWQDKLTKILEDMCEGFILITKPLFKSLSINCHPLISNVFKLLLISIFFL